MQESKEHGGANNAVRTSPYPILAHLQSTVVQDIRSIYIYYNILAHLQVAPFTMPSHTDNDNDTNTSNTTGTALPTSPARTIHMHSNSHVGNGTPNRPRMNSRDIPRSYSGLFGQGGDDCDLLPFELARSQHTDWLEEGGLLLLILYIGGIGVFEVLALAAVDYTSSYPLEWTWTITSVMHCLITLVYLHWLKGSLFDEQGEMAALTLWEQLEGRPKTAMVKRILTLVPTLLCYAACHFAHYDIQLCAVNGFVWAICILGKLPFMNGVRIFGINQTTGIDDEYEYDYPSKQE